MVEELTNREFESFTREGLVLIDFFAEWCMPCMMMIPVVEDLSDRFEGKIKFGKVNVQDNPELAQKFNVSSIPNFTLFKNGKPIKTFIGAMSEDDFEDKLNEFL